MEITMLDATTTETAAAETSGDSTTTAAATDATTTTETATTTAGEAALGDAGKKALDAMKAERKAARDEAANLKAQLDALQAKVDGKEAEFTAQQENQRVKDEALSAANKRILNSEIKAAAKGVLADPQDAYKFLDLNEFEVDADGNVDEAAITAAITKLITDKPYLAAQGGKKFQGSADGGARNDATKVAQLSRADMAGMTPEQIVEAHDAGRFADITRGS
jgi:hypothetical protein